MAEDLLGTHVAYKAHAKEADFFFRSYVGGKLYRQGEYLTKYLGEDLSPGDSYGKRLESTPLDNHVKTTVDIYGSFIFRNLPHRTLGSLANNASVELFMKDTDMNGQTLDSFMKTVNDMAMVMGNMWLLVDKPNYAVQTQAEAEALGIRAYVCTYTPQNVLDWEYRKNVAGKNELVYIKVVEHESNTTSSVTEWTPQTITKTVVAKDEKTGDVQHTISEDVFTNPLGMVPFINYAPVPQPTKGMGYSLIGDVAYAQKYIYNLLSELEQNIKISGHPSLVKTPSTRASAGAGAIIEVQEDMDPQLKPYLLQPSGSSIVGILDTINATVQAIHRMTHTSAVQIMRGSPMSGVALQTERQLLNTKLADISHTLQETEYKIWDLFFKWQALEAPEEFEVSYASTFDIRDEHADLELYSKAIEAVSDPAFVTQMNVQIAELLIKDEETLNTVVASIEPSETMQHATTTPENRSQHIQEMIMQGLTDQQILDLHPEIAQADIETAKRELLELNQE